MYSTRVALSLLLPKDDPLLVTSDVLVSALNLLVGLGPEAVGSKEWKDALGAMRDSARTFGDAVRARNTKSRLTRLRRQTRSRRRLAEAS